jgi:phosphoglycolate phosphatase
VPAPIRLVVFDLDGTLVDSRRDLAESANALLAQCGCRPLSEDAIGRMVGDGAATLVTRAFIAAGCQQPPDALARFLAIYNARLLMCTRPYPGIGEVLNALEARLMLALLTNKPLEPTRRILAGLDLARFFPAARVLGGDGVLPRKPDPSGLRHLAAAASVSGAETMLVGDSLIDWRTARAAEVRICLARYGFGFAGFPVDQLGPDDRFVDSPTELLEFL